ncbi:MAG: hypothetical protein ACI9FJ_002417, partial [Alteromonadaceae bacterium]
GLAIAYALLGVFYRDNQVDKPKSVEYFTQAKKLWVELTRDCPGFVEYQQNLAFVEKALGDDG